MKERHAAKKMRMRFELGIAPSTSIAPVYGTPALTVVFFNLPSSTPLTLLAYHFTHACDSALLNSVLRTVLNYTTLGGHRGLLVKIGTVINLCYVILMRSAF